MEQRNAEARATEAKRLQDGRRNVQGIMEHFASYLSMLGIIDEGSDLERCLGVGEDGPGLSRRRIRGRAQRGATRLPSGQLDAVRPLRIRSAGVLRVA